MERTAGQSNAAPSYPVMTIYAHETLPPGIIAKLDGSQLFVDPSAPPEQQLDGDRRRRAHSAHHPGELGDVRVSG
jgi:hypothetical protein